MTVSISALRGFLLEESLSKLLENSGYTLINKDVLKYPKEYPEFVSQGNGLNIKGRGGTHQADVLGQFPIAIPFNYPVRLFLEAKFRNKKSGIDVVRSGIGILTDLNANYQTISLDNDELLVQRFNYQYAIFSTSGFSENAIRLAIAYKITLVDLSGDEYINLLREIDEVAYKLKKLMLLRRITLNAVREYIRHKLFNINIDNYVKNISDLNYVLSPLFYEIDKYKDLYLASINSPFSILIKPLSPEEFRDFLEEYKESTFEVRINWNDKKPNLWKIYLYSFSRGELTFTFYLPEVIRRYVFNSPGDPNILVNALNAKKQFFSSMVFYVRSAEKFITFKYSKRILMNDKK
ncbi:restriction endonuclease [Priestia megaterium]|uniref:hypothetical protein n=1 Tax=Priestia megaterium TaxID=1404 RepID=UPI002B24AE68|nr:hypothetical protein [Priestia megaterium]MEB2268106.1 restriction endonuclease [Priestia megaterium]